MAMSPLSCSLLLFRRSSATIISRRAFYPILPSYANSFMTQNALIARNRTQFNSQTVPFFITNVNNKDQSLWNRRYSTTSDAEDTTFYDIFKADLQEEENKGERINGEENRHLFVLKVIEFVARYLADKEGAPSSKLTNEELQFAILKLINKSEEFTIGLKDAVRLGMKIDPKSYEVEAINLHVLKSYVPCYDQIKEKTFKLLGEIGAKYPEDAPKMKEGKIVTRCQC